MADSDTTSTVTFPDGFFWGTATAAHQVEGGNWNNDWWMWEHDPSSQASEPSGDACDHYHRYPDDIRLLAQLGFGAYRFSVEWSRIEPEEGEWSRAALDHYRRMCAACHEAGVTPIVTMHHFTTPRWVAAHGGWEDPATADRFARLCEKVGAAFGDVIGSACTLNEPNVVATLGYGAGFFPPGRKDAALRLAVNDIFVDAHRKGRDALKAARGDFPVGLTLAMADYQAVDGGEEERDRIREVMEDGYLRAAVGDDFIGVQTYTRTRVGPDGRLGPEEGVELTQMGWEFWPEALEATIRRAWEVTQQTPVVVTENGVAAEDDRRVDYVSRALRGVRRCLDDGIDVRGYVYWTLMDNFEWNYGYKPRFGVLAVDRETYERTVKPSGAWLGEVARANALVPYTG